MWQVTWLWTWFENPILLLKRVREEREGKKGERGVLEGWGWFSPSPIYYAHWYRHCLHDNACHCHGASGQRSAEGPPVFSSSKMLWTLMGCWATLGQHILHLHCFSPWHFQFILCWFLLDVPPNWCSVITFWILRLSYNQKWICFKYYTPSTFHFSGYVLKT